MYFFQIEGDPSMYEVSGTRLDEIVDTFGGWNWEGFGAPSSHLDYWAEAGDLAPCAFKDSEGRGIVVGILIK